MLIEKLSQPDEPEEEEKPKRRGGALAKKGGKRTAKPEPESNGQVEVFFGEGDAIALDAANLMNLFAGMVEALEGGATSIQITYE
jgi:hypothetical protein